MPKRSAHPIYHRWTYRRHKGTLCPLWADDWPRFRDDLTPGYLALLAAHPDEPLNRIHLARWNERDGHDTGVYEPGNVVWLTSAQNTYAKTHKSWDPRTPIPDGPNYSERERARTREQRRTASPEERERARERRRVSNMTPEQIERAREYSRNKTPEQRARKNELAREYRRNITPEQRAHKNERERERWRKLRG